MKSSRILLALMTSVSLVATGVFAQTFGVHYSFDTEMDGTGDFTLDVANSTFPGASSIEWEGSERPTTPTGGESSFTDFQGNTWLGSGGTGTPGHSLVWSPDSEGNFFHLTLNTQGLTEIDVRMGVRDAISSGQTRAGGFESFTYDLDDGSGPIEITGTPGFGANNNFNEWSMDLSSLTAIENQPSVTFRWDVPDIDSDSSLRIDNVQFTAIPEPSTLVLILGVAGLAFARFRRRL